MAAGWTARDLAAHLVVRDRRPDTGPGALLSSGPLARHTERVRLRVRDATPFDELVAEVRAGGLLGKVPAVDDRVNTVEMAVHHEDLRRAGPGPVAPRVLDGATEAALWQQVPLLARVLARPAKDAALVLTDGGSRRTSLGRGARQTTVTGPPLELVLWVFGRRDAAQVEVRLPAP